MEETGNPIVDLSFKFAIDIISFTELLEQEKKYVIARQLLKSGTSIGANSDNYPFNSQLLNDLRVIKKVLNKIISTSKTNKS